MPENNSEKNHQIDPVFKQLVEDLFPQLKVGIKTQVEVNRLPLTIDALATVDNEEGYQHLKQETPFFYFLRHNQIEFKGAEDPLTRRDYHRICGRTQLYLSEHDIEPDEMMVTIVCANRPRNVLTYKKIRDRFRRLQPGYYRSASMPNIYLIVIRELPPIPQNYPLLVFTGDAAQFRVVLEKMLSEDNITLLPYAWRTQPLITKEVMNMKRRGRKMTFEESLHLFVEDFGDDLVKIIPVERLLSVINPTQWLEGLDPAQRLQGLDPAQRLEGLDPAQRLEGLDPAQRLEGLTLEQRKILLDKLLQSLLPEQQPAQPISAN